MKRRAITLIAVLHVIGYQGSASLAQSVRDGSGGQAQPAKLTAIAEATKCACEVFPWTPKDCVKTCTTAIFSLPMPTIDKYLQTASYKKALSDIQVGGVSESEVDAFLNGTEGKAFLFSVETSAKSNNLKTLAAQAGKSTPKS